MWEHLNGKTLTDRGRQLERWRQKRENEQDERETGSEHSDRDRGNVRERKGQQDLSAFVQ